MSGETRLFTYMAVPCWMLWTWAFADMLLGNPTAINGVIGIGFAATLAFRHQDRPTRETETKPDYAKIVRLERELGIDAGQHEKKRRTP